MRVVITQVSLGTPAIGLRTRPPPLTKVRPPAYSRVPQFLFDQYVGACRRRAPRDQRPMLKVPPMARPHRDLSDTTLRAPSPSPMALAAGMSAHMSRRRHAAVNKIIKRKSQFRTRGTEATTMGAQQGTTSQRSRKSSSFTRSRC